jgi:hypothetical protein
MIVLLILSWYHEHYQLLHCYSEESYNHTYSFLGHSEQGLVQRQTMLHSYYK